MFYNSGVNIPITVIHQGYTRYLHLKKPTKLNNGYFTVGLLGTPVKRKNVSKIYNACKFLENEGIPIRLKLHIALNYADVSRIMINDPMVEITRDSLSYQKISEWYSNLSCYVYPSSGEGWSFTPRESLYLNIPTIITNIPVHQELVDSGFYEVVKLNGSDVKVKDIKKAIHNVFLNYDIMQSKANAGAEWIKNMWFNAETLNLLCTFVNGIV